jgi:hypothetical protein
MNIQFCDERFDCPQGWKDYWCAAGFRQRYLHDEHLIHSETNMTVRCSWEAAVKEISGPWTWWEHGRISGYRRLEDGSSEQVLSPVWWYLTRIVLRIYPPILLEHETGIRIPIGMRRHFNGTASMDVLAGPEPGCQTIRGRFHAVENHIPLIPFGFVTSIHLRAEAGAHFPRGTGWCGLRTRLIRIGNSSPEYDTIPASQMEERESSFPY